MKLWFCAALLAAGTVHAGELLPMAGKDSEHMQRALDEYLKPVAAALPDGVEVQPILDEIDISGRGKHLFWGPLAGSSEIVLRVRIVDHDAVAEQTFTARGGAWKGTFRPGRDYEMVDSIAEQAAEFVRTYSASRIAAQ